MSSTQQSKESTLLSKDGKTNYRMGEMLYRMLMYILKDKNMNCYKELKELNSMKESNLPKMGKKIIEIVHRRQNGQ